MSFIPARVRTAFFVMVCGSLALTWHVRSARAWAIGNQFNTTGCHEPITAQALRSVRASLNTAPTLTPSRDEAALIADVLFAPPSDFIPDLAGMSLLLGVRDNDLKGIDPLSSLDLIQVHGSPTTQQEHCIRSSSDDNAIGNQTALAACQTFIVNTAIAALDGLDSNGTVDATKRTDFTLYVSIRGQVTVPLPLFYIRIGAAMHALEDGVPHTYRTADGMQVTVVLNWIDIVNGTYQEPRDGPPHRADLDRCWASDPILLRNYNLSIQAATELLTAALDPALSRDQKIAQFNVITARYLTFEPGCTFDNNWCDSAEAKVTNSLTGCNVADASGISLFVLVALGGVMLGRRRRRVHTRVIGSVLLLGVAVATTARADDPPPATPIAAPVAASTASDTPAVVATEPAAQHGQEPGRDVKTPTVAQVAAIREDKKLGSPWGFAASVGGSVDRTALAGSIGGRYRITEEWIVGLDAGWNPWITTSPIQMKAGVATGSATLIRRFPMKFDRVNLRTSLHLGTSTLLFDVYGAPKYSTGPYIAFRPLGIDYDLGNSVRIVLDPMEMALPVPLIGQLPLYYEQFRFMIGIQIGG